jgi:hypothetical protein
VSECSSACRMKIVVQVPRNCNPSGFVRMLVLPMASLGFHMPPAVTLNGLDGITDLHLPK